MKVCVIKRHCPLLESYKISVGDEIVILTGERLSIRGKTPGGATFFRQKPHMG